MVKRSQIRVLVQARRVLRELRDHFAQGEHPEGMLNEAAKTADRSVFNVLNLIDTYEHGEVEDHELFGKEKQ